MTFSLNRIRSHSWLIPLLLGLATCAVYANSLYGAMVFDDLLRLAQNPAIRQLWPPAWATYDRRPVAYFTFAVNYVLHGTEVPGWHMVNIAIHLAAGLTLYGILRRTLHRCLPATDNGPPRAEILAGLTTLLWLVHPLQTQSVTYIVQRIEALMGLFFLLTLYSFIRAQDSQRRTVWLATSVMYCGLSCATKEVGAMAPLIVLWYDRAFLAESWREIVRSRRWYYAGLASCWLLLAWLMTTRWDTYHQGAGKVPGITPLFYFVNQPPVILHYLRLAFLPVGQNLDRTWLPGRDAGELLFPFLLVTLLFLLTVVAIRKWPRWSFLGGWFFVILAPTSSFVPIMDLSFEHRMYLPLAAVAALVVIGGEQLLQRQTADGRRRKLVTLAGCLALVAATALGATTAARNRVYETRRTLWANVLETAPHNARAHNELSQLLYAAGDLQPALRHAERAVELIPINSDYASHLACMAYEAGQRERGIILAAEIVRNDPEHAGARMTLGTLLIAHSPEKAREHLQVSVELDPESSEAWANLGMASAGTSHEKAAECYARAIQLNSANAIAHNNLANLLARQGKYVEALQHYQLALAARPGYEEARKNRQIVREMQAGGTGTP